MLPHGRQGDNGPSASKLYVVKSGKFEVLQTIGAASVRVNMKEPGDCFGEIGLMYSVPRTASVAATTDATVWLLDRNVFR